MAKQENISVWKYRVHGLMQSARLATWPTIATNSLVAWVLVGGAASGWQYVMTAILGTCLLWYGMWMNDAVDADWDAENSPNRPVPKGKVSVKMLKAFARVALCGAVCLVVVAMPMQSIWIFPCLIFIALYNLLHKASRWAVFLMAAARGAWVLVACVMLAHEPRNQGAWDFVGVLPDKVWWYVASLSIYTLVVSAIAELEDKYPRMRRVVGWLLAGMCLHDAVWLLVCDSASAFHCLMLGSLGVMGFALAIFLMHRGARAS